MPHVDLPRVATCGKHVMPDTAPSGMRVLIVTLEHDRIVAVPDDSAWALATPDELVEMARTLYVNNQVVLGAKADNIELVIVAPSNAKVSELLRWAIHTQKVLREKYRHPRPPLFLIAARSDADGATCAFPLQFDRKGIALGKDAAFGQIAEAAARRQPLLVRP